MAFDPVSGDLVDADFIAADINHLNTPIHAVLNTCTVPTILVSDQLNDVVQAYDLDGNYLEVFAPSGGVDLAILDNVRGIWSRQGYVFLVTVGAGPNDDALAGFYPQSGVYFGNFIASGALPVSRRRSEFTCASTWRISSSAVPTATSSIASTSTACRCRISLPS